jgi:hypothetical protein
MLHELPTYMVHYNIIMRASKIVSRTTNYNSVRCKGPNSSSIKVPGVVNEITLQLKSCFFVLDIIVGIHELSYLRDIPVLTNSRIHRSRPL